MNIKETLNLELIAVKINNPNYIDPGMSGKSFYDLHLQKCKSFKISNAFTRPRLHIHYDSSRFREARHTLNKL